MPVAEPGSAAVMPGEGMIKGFDGLRALAVFMVMSIHLGAYLGRFKPYGLLTDGVSIFFVISGFLITGILMRDSRRSVGRFYLRRFLRLYPALLLYLGGVLVFRHFGWAVVPTSALVAGLLYVSNYAPFSTIAKESSHLWSLGVEEQFYVIWPFVIFYLRRLAIPLAVVGVCVSWWLRVYPLTDPNRYVNRYFIPAADAILIGALAALLVCPRYRRSERVRRAVGAPEVLCLGFALYLTPSWLILPKLNDVQNSFVAVDLQRVGVALIVLWIATNQSSTLVRILDVTPLRYLGRISYGIYLWQGLFVRNGPGNPQGWFHRYPYNVVLAVAVAALSFELVERRFLRLKDRIGRSHRSDEGMPVASTS